VGYIKKTTRTPLVAMLMASVLWGCSGVLKKAPLDAEPAVSETPAVEVALEILPNPYLATKPSVPDKAKDEFAQATEAMNAEQWSKAEGILVLMTETWPNLSGPYVNLGIAQYRQSHLAQAEDSLKGAIHVNAANMDAYTWLGVLYREQGRFNDAEANYKAALAIWPHHVDSLRNLGILYDLYLGRFDEALVQYKLLQRVLPEESRQLKGWVRDLERRLADKG